MFARVSLLQGSPEQLAKAIGIPILPEVQQMRGFKGAYALLDRKNGKGILMTLWDTEEAMQASAERAKQIRGQIATEAGAKSPPVVETYEVIGQP